MEYIIWLFILFLFSVVNSSGKVDKLFISDFNGCHLGFNGTFSVTSLTIDKEFFSNVLIPNENLSCSRSGTITLARGGILQVKIYATSVVGEDYLTVLVYGEEDNDVVGEASLPEGANGDTGWTVVDVVLEGKEQYEGYIMLTGKASSTSKILVESICYTPPQQKLPEDTEFNVPQTDSVLRSESERSFRIFGDEDFWTPLTISLAVIIPVIILALICWGCFALGKRQGGKQTPQIVYEDIDNIPKPYLVPRVKSVYAESITSSYGGRNNNNIYSV